MEKGSKTHVNTEIEIISENLLAKDNGSGTSWDRKNALE